MEDCRPFGQDDFARPASGTLDRLFYTTETLHDKFLDAQLSKKIGPEFRSY